MVKEAVRKESCIVCHSTLNTVCPAVCRGFFDGFKTLHFKLRRGWGTLRKSEDDEMRIAAAKNERPTRERKAEKSES